jgi:hypothetical protein
MTAVKHPRDEWEWFGSAAHFICGRWCRFHLATLVGPWLVSTVGEYVPPSKSGSERAEAEFLARNKWGDTIGCDRKFETMVFRAGKRCADSDCGCGLPAIASSELEMWPYNDRASAQLGHDEMCGKWSTVADGEEPR